MDKEQEYNPDLITVQDDEGNEHIFEELDRIETDQGRYVAMLPTFDSEEEMLESDSELIILKVFEEGDETYLAAIEDDDERSTSSKPTSSRKTSSKRLLGVNRQTEN